MAKEELGKDAIVMNIKTIKPKGFLRFLRKTSVEITAAVDENIVQTKKNRTTEANNTIGENEYMRDAATLESNPAVVNKSSESTSAIEEKLNSLAQMLERQMTDVQEVQTEAKDENGKIVKLVYDQLVNNEVDDRFAQEIINEIDNSGKKLVLDDLLANVYQKIVLKLGQMKTIEVQEDKPQIILFVGPTGVGKTTTIAKLASKFKLEEKAKIVIITADTYRIAAVEQIRTYANILSVPIEVVYNADEMQKAVKQYEDYDLIFVDTAGRSHKNEEQCEDIKKLIESVRNYKQEVYLVVSATTKYRDLLKIAQKYSDITSYNLLFTKLDETNCLGNILNMKLATNESLSYTAWGQNVPEDLGITDAQYVAKQLLGGNE